MNETISSNIINIIVPIYNVEDELPRCVNSLLNQTYKNIRIILVDDGSTDHSRELCNQYANEDKRIVVVHQQNGGVSAARNAGLNYIFSLPIQQRGKYLTFVDPDDWVDDDFVEFLLKLKERSHADIVQCGHWIDYTNNLHHDKDPQHKFARLDLIHMLESLCRNGIWDVTLWNKLYPIDLFSNIRFPTGKRYEDTAASYQIAAQCNQVAIDMTPKYHYVQRYTSIANGTTWNNSKLDLVEVGDEMASWVEQHYPQLADAVLEKRIFVRLSTLAQMVNTGYNDRTLIRQMRGFVMKHAMQILRDPRASRRDKLGVLALIPGYTCFRILWSILYLFRRRRAVGQPAEKLGMEGRM